MKEKKASGKKEKGSIPVVDDEPAIRDILVRTLAAEGHQVSTADSGDAALSRMAEVCDDIYIIDLKMPGIGGMQFYKKVEKTYPDLVKKIMFITGDTVSPDTQRFFISTGRPYLMKPFAYIDLITLVGKMLEES